MGQTTCQRCGSTDVAWFQGMKSGKWYLGQVTDGVADRFDFHSKHCTGEATPAPVQGTPDSWGAMATRYAEVPAGRYAFVKPGFEEVSLQEAAYDFFQVRRPKTGNWKGYVFVDRLI